MSASSVMPARWHPSKRGSSPAILEMSMPAKSITPSFSSGSIVLSSMPIWSSGVMSAVMAPVEAFGRVSRPLGTHWGASHELEVQWAELVQRLVRSAERVRFTASGTEATQLALRLARAYTGKTKILRFVGHFHGWHDAVAPGAMSHYDGSLPAGIPAALAAESILLGADSPAPALDALENRDDIAALILEPSGASWGQVPL